MEWQTFDTAPIDGTKFLTFFERENGDFDIHMCWWNGNGFAGFGWSYADWHLPTHWAHLPALPTPSKAKQVETATP